MLTLFKKLFGKAGKPTVGPLAPSASTPTPAQMQFESAIQMAKVEVAKLSLKAIVAKFPEDIRGLLNSVPDDTATVALPIQTILKQLPAGVVRMSLASLHRQAPAGLFKPMPAGDKRMVEVPLAEVFKHVKPTAFKRRNDQRQVGPVEEDFEVPVFNSRVETKPVTPIIEIDEEIEEPATPEPAPSGMRIVAPPSGLSPATPKAAPVAPPVKATAAPARVAPKRSGEPVLVLPLAKLSQGWPEEISGALAGLDPATTVEIPHSHIAPGLARGKITCTWKQLQGWLTPAAAKNPGIDAEAALLLPLKVVAPAFLAATKTPATTRKSVTVDETIPALFSGGRVRPQPEEEAPQPTAPVGPSASETPPAATETAPPAESAAVPSADISSEAKPAAPEIPDQTPPAAPQDAPVADASNQASATDPEATPPVIAEESSPASSEQSAPQTPVEAPSAPASAQTVGDLLGDPERTEWTPAALVSAIVKLPGVAGAIVALQEGFQVAHALPEGVNPETVSAFLPQIFTRLNQYAGEMKLGDVDDLLFTTRGAHCLIYRLGTIYLAVLGKPGESLPWNALRLAAAELSRQVTK